MIVQKIMHKGFMDKYTNNITGTNDTFTPMKR